MKDLVGTVYEIVESNVNPIQLDGYVNTLFSGTEPMLKMLDEMDLTFVQAVFVLDKGKPCVGHSFDLEASLLALDEGVTLELVYQDEFETPYYFKVRQREVW